MEYWVPIENFEGYGVSDQGHVMNSDTLKTMVPSVNQQGILRVGLMREGIQHHRSVARLVADHFLPPPVEPDDTPIHLDGNRLNCAADNLTWRPRWIAIMYHKQFKIPYQNHINKPIMNMSTGEKFTDSFSAARHCGLLERQVVLCVLGAIEAVPPTWHKFRLIED